MNVINKDSATSSHKNKKCGNCKNFSSVSDDIGTCDGWKHETMCGEGGDCVHWEIREKWKVCSKCGEVKERGELKTLVKAIK